MKKITTLFILLFAGSTAIAQPGKDTTAVDLDAYLNANNGSPKEKKELVTATFKSSRIITGHSTELVKPKHLEFRISHRFNSVRDGIDGFFGLDLANVRIALEYGINDYLMVGLGRSGTAGKPVDAFIKAKLLRQRKNGVPITLGVFGSTLMNSEKAPYDNYRFDSRLSYCAQLLIASKISDAISLQLTPTLIHRNLVPTAAYPNDLVALGAGGRVKVSRRVSINVEYYYRFLSAAYRKIDPYHNSLSIGVDIDTGGHIFSLHFTNSQPQIERGFIGETSYNWLKGDFCFGFNITRQFYLGKKNKAATEW